MWLSLLRFKSFIAFLRGLPAPMTVWESKVSSKGLFGEGWEKKKKHSFSLLKSLSRLLGILGDVNTKASHLCHGYGWWKCRSESEHFPLTTGYKSTTSDSVSCLHTKRPTGFLNTHKPHSYNILSTAIWFCYGCFFLSNVSAVTTSKCNSPSKFTQQQ